MTTKSQDAAQDVAALLRARNSLIWIVTREEARVEQLLFDAARKIGYLPRTWDVAAGVADADGKPEPDIGGREPETTLAFIQSYATGGPQTEHRGVWIMRDLPTWITGQGGAATLRQLRNLVRLLPEVPLEAAQTVIVISPSGDVPPELSNHATVIEWPLPDREEIERILDARIAATPQLAESIKNGARDAAIDAAIGLSGEEVAACYARSAVKHKAIVPAEIASQKRRIIAKERVLEYFDPLPGGLDTVGGLENLKTWLTARKAAYSAAARAYGLPAPKGALIVGIAGTGKSLTAKATATAWGVPLLRLDLGALKSKFVGESEQNLRKVFQVVQTIGRCVLWIDEIEKALQGATTDSSDGGVSADALGALLSWMQDRAGECFVIATANDVSRLPPELLRKGRFDEIWWVDLPTPVERVSILRAALKSFGREITEQGLIDVTGACEGFTGAEIAAIVPEAMFAAFADGARELKSVDLFGAAKTVVPLSKTAKEKITKLREWAVGRARPASAPEVTDKTARLRVLDI